MTKPWEMDDDFLLFLNSGDVGTEPLEPGQTTVRSAFRQRLEIPLTLTDQWQVALLKLLYTNSYGNTVLKSSQDYHVRVGSSDGSVPTRSTALTSHKHYTHAAELLGDLVQKMGWYVIPTLSGGQHHYGQLHMESPGTTDQNFPTNPKLDLFRPDLVREFLQSIGNTYRVKQVALPTRFLQIEYYIGFALLKLMGLRGDYIWLSRASPSRPKTHYSLHLWAQGQYNLGESLALLMGFLEPDPDRPGQTRIVAHNTVYADTGEGTQADWVVSRLDTDHFGIETEDFLLGGVSIKLNTAVERLHYTFGKRAVFDMGAWVRDPSPLLPYARQSPVTVVTTEPGKWFLQAREGVYVDFKNGLETVMGTPQLKAPSRVKGFGAWLALPGLETSLAQTNTRLSNVDLTRCHTEVDVVEFSPVGDRQRRLLATLPLSPSSDYGLTVEYDPQHLDFRPLAGPTQNLSELRVHLRNAEGLGVPFYTGLTGVWLYFRKGGTKNTKPLQSAGMSFAGGRRVTLESDDQKDLFPNNTPSRFRLRLPEQWTLDATWEVALVQLLMPHTFHNVQDRQIQCSVNYPSGKQDIFLAGGLYVTLADVVLALHQAIETETPVSDAGTIARVQLQLDEKGFYGWTFPTNDFSLYLPGWLARVLGYLDWESWTVPFYYKSDVRHPTVEITSTDTQTGRPTEVEITRSHTMALPADHRVWSFISPNSFQNVYVHCNVAEPVYVGSQMAKVVLIHGINPQKGVLEDVPIPHLIFSRLSHFTFRDLEIDIRDNLGRPIPFQGGNVTAALYFRQRKLP